MNENINTTTVANPKKKITAKNISAEDTVRLLRDIDSAIFQTADENLIIFNLPVCDVMVQYLKLHYFYPTEFEKIEDFGGFYDDLFAGKFKDYITAMDKTETAKLIDNAVQMRKQITIGKLQNPMVETIKKINDILDTLAENTKDIEPDALKKFINDFSDFAKNNNPETLTEIFLKKKSEE